MKNTLKQIKIFGGEENFLPDLVPRVQIDTARQVLDGIDASETTRKDYQARIKNFLVFTSENGINRDSYLEYKRELEKNASLSVASKNKQLATAKAYLKELCRKGIVTVDLTLGVKQFAQTKTHKKFGHTSDEVKRILELIDESSLRDKALMYLLFFQGLRQVEVIRLEAQDINYIENKALILGKGRDDKEIIDLHPKVSAVLKEYTISYGIRNGQIFDITERTLRNIYHRLSDRLGITKTLHGARKYFITKMLEVLDGDLNETRKYSRHRSFDMLIVYSDDISKQKTLPKFYETFDNVTEEPVESSTLFNN